jgi:polyhydroxyalkanoate synthesis regulator phasin
MNPFGGIVQKAFYLGMGLASLAGEKAGSTLSEIRNQATKLAEDLVERGEMTAEEARKFVDDLVRQAQQPIGESKSDAKSDRTGSQQAPRTIEIFNDDETFAGANPTDVDNLKQKVQELQEELKRMQKN